MSGVGLLDSRMVELPGETAGLKSITIPYDNDPAGRSGAQKLAVLAVGLGLSAVVVQMPASLGSDSWAARMRRPCTSME